MMKRLVPAILVASWSACSPGYQSGKTRCSTQGDCPSGFICSDDGSGSADVCLTKPSFCSDAATFYCVASESCWKTAVACSTVFNCGTSASPAFQACASPGYVPDCTGTTCLPASSGTGGAPGRSDASADARTPDSRSCPPPAAGGTCNVFPSCGCPAGQMCYPNTSATGLTCQTTDGVGAGAACEGRGCADGLGCFGGVCKAYCQADTDCPTIDGARECSPTYWNATDVIAGVSVCSRVCDPVSPQSPRSPLLGCPVGTGCFSGGTSSPGASDCGSQAGTGTSGSACSTEADCTPGYYCSVGGTCIKYCYTATDCPTGMTCVSFSTPNYAGTVQVKHCSTPQ